MIATHRALKFVLGEVGGGSGWQSDQAQFCFHLTIIKVINVMVQQIIPQYFMFLVLFAGWEERVLGEGGREACCEWIDNSLNVKIGCLLRSSMKLGNGWAADGTEAWRTLCVSSRASSIIPALWLGCCYALPFGVTHPDISRSNSFSSMMTMLVTWIAASLGRCH